MSHVMGCDPHLDTIAVAVTDQLGRSVIETTVANTPGGWDTTVRLCRRHGVEVVGIEAASGYGQSLARRLTGAGVTVNEIPTRLTATYRKLEGRGKTDPGDARAVCRAVAAGNGHPWVDAPDAEALRVTVSRRRSLIAAQTRDINALRALVAEVDPQRAAGTKRLSTVASLTPFTRVRYAGNTHRATVAVLIRDLARDCVRRRNQINQLTRQIRTLLPPAAHKLIAAVRGLNVVGAAVVFAELAGTNGFDTDAKFAMWAGVAPIPVSSGRTDKFRLNRGGNRQVNAVLHTIVLTQLRYHGEAADYIARRLSEGKPKKEVIRAAKRHVARRLHRLLTTTS
jgi:transposase